MSSSSTFTGFMMKSYAPSLRLAIAVLTSAAPVRTITAASGSACRTCWSRSMPPMIGILRSVTVSGERELRIEARNTSTPSWPSLASRHL
jgi:hypothetical protein